MAVLSSVRPITGFDANGWTVMRTDLQTLVNKVMVDNKLDALVYPTKEYIPGAVACRSRRARNVKVVRTLWRRQSTDRNMFVTVERVTDAIAPLTWRLSPTARFPTIAVPCWFHKEVYDRVAVKARMGLEGRGLVGPKLVELPVSIDFLGRSVQ